MQTVAGVVVLDRGDRRSVVYGRTPRAVSGSRRDPFVALRGDGI